jgi:signal transduction histidine kinase
VAFRKQKQFVADASHELRTPIAIVRGEADVTLQRAVREEPEYREALAVIRDESVRLTRIVDDLFLLARTDAGGPLDRRERVDAIDLLSAGLRSVRTIADAKGVHLNASLPSQPPDVVVIGDRALLRRLLLNLLDNALKNTPRGGCVTVSVTATATMVTIVVADNGRGIARELRPRIFERFVRAELAPSDLSAELLDHERGGVAVGAAPSASGAGLGLAIAQAIAHAHDGQISLDEVSVGASFRVTLPRDQTSS